MKLNALPLALMLATSLILTSCGGGGAGGGGHHYTPLVTAESFVSKLNQLDPQFEAYVIDKKYTQAPGFIVFYDAYEMQTVAIDIQQMRNWGYTAHEAASSYIYGDFYSISEFVSDSTYSAIQAWINSGYTEIFYEGLNSGFLYDMEEKLLNQGHLSKKDLFTVKARVQESKDFELANVVADLYELDNIETAQNIVREYRSYTSVPAEARTQNDARTLIKGVTGLEFDELKSAYTAQAQGDSTAINALLQKAVDAGKFSIEDAHRAVDIVLSEINNAEPFGP